MITVHKYPVSYSGLFYIELPEGAEFLTVQIQNGKPQMWFRVDDTHYVRAQYFGIVGTGLDMDKKIEHAPYLGTVQEGSFVWHLFGGLYA